MLQRNDPRVLKIPYISNRGINENKLDFETKIFTLNCTQILNDTVDENSPIVCTRK